MKQPPPRRRIAAIDIGSNSIKLAVAEKTGGAASGDFLNIILQQRERVRAAGGKFLSPATIEKSAAVVKDFRAIAEAHGVETIIAVATASAREAANRRDFVGAIERAAGVCVRVLAAVEEARLIGLAARYYFCDGAAQGALLNIDIGGGSTELSLMKAGEAEPEKLFSMPLGALLLTGKFLSSNPPTAVEIENLRAEINRHLEKPSAELRRENRLTATGTSGTILKFGGLLNAENGEIQLARLAELNRKLAKMTVAERAALPNISEKRAELLVAGGLILEGAMRALKIESLRPCEFALREGVLIDFFSRSKSPAG